MITPDALRELCQGNFINRYPEECAALRQAADALEVREHFMLTLRENIPLPKGVGLMEYIRRVEKERDEARAQLAAMEKEIGEFQNTMRDSIVEFLGKHGTKDPGAIDGGGCDSGDWRDFSHSELSQGLGAIEEEIIDPLRSRLAEANESLARVRKLASEDSVALSEKLAALKAAGVEIAS